MLAYIQPQNNAKSFTCPHCGTVSQMIYFGVSWKKDKSRWNLATENASYMHVAICQNCDRPIIWIDDEYVYPEIIGIEANADMPEAVKALYNEAAIIYNKSPRAACALLRLAVERLCNELGETGSIR